MTCPLHDNAINEAVDPGLSANESPAQRELIARQMLEFSPIANVLVDHDGLIVFVNRELELLTGHEREELFGKPIEILLPKRYRAAHATQRKNYASAPSPRKMANGRQLTALHKDGKEIPVEIGINPIQINEDSYVLAAISDISERVEAEQVLEERRKQLVEALLEKDSLLREIHHRVKNNLQIIASVLRMQSRGVDSESSKAAFRDCINRVLVMSEVHERLYQSEKMDAIDMGGHLKYLAEQQIASSSRPGQRIELKISADPIPFDLNDAIPLGLLANELFINALKHGFANREQGTLSPEFKKQPLVGVRLVVADDGNGFSQEDLTNSRSSLGMTLIQDLVDQLRGRLEISGENGARACVDLPLVKIKT